MNEWMNEQIDAKMFRWLNECMNGWMNERMNGWMQRWIDG